MSSFAILEALLFAGDAERIGDEPPPRRPILAKEPLRLLVPAVSVPDM